jgi:hypothetical protein
VKGLLNIQGAMFSHHSFDSIDLGREMQGSGRLQHEEEVKLTFLIFRRPNKCVSSFVVQSLQLISAMRLLL